MSPSVDTVGPQLTLWQWSAESPLIGWADLREAEAGELPPSPSSTLPWASKRDACCAFAFHHGPVGKNRGRETKQPPRVPNLRTLFCQQGTTCSMMWIRTKCDAVVFSGSCAARRATCSQLGPGSLPRACHGRRDALGSSQI